jgi:hypothetical protein
MTDGTGLLVSGQTHNRIITGQESQISDLRSRFPQRIEHVGVQYGFPDKQLYDLAGLESSQRTRAFIHTALGSIAALMAGQSQLFLFENGFGALNLPCDSAQIGSQNSRGTHPVFLRRMAAFVSTVFSRHFIIANPFTLSTKGQMLSASSVCCFSPLLAKSFSCDRFPNYHHSASQCGCCPSCLIRRLSFYVARSPDNSSAYSTDIFHPRRPLRMMELFSLGKLNGQVGSLASCLSTKQPWTALCAEWPDLLRTEIELDSPAFREGAITLLRRHVEEWRSFSRVIQPGSFALAA